MASGPWPAATLVLAGAGLCAVGVPRQLVCYAAGAAFGAAGGIALALIAQMLGCVLNLLGARLLARRWVAARLRGRLARLDRSLASRPFVSVLALRLLPVGSNVLLNLIAGVSAVATAPFLAATAVGYLPQTLAFAFAGSGAHLGHTAQVATAAILFAVSAGLGVWLLRRRDGVRLSSGDAGVATPTR